MWEKKAPKVDPFAVPEIDENADSQAANAFKISDFYDIENNSKPVGTQQYQNPFANDSDMMNQLHYGQNDDAPDSNKNSHYSEQNYSNEYSEDGEGEYYEAEGEEEEQEDEDDYKEDEGEDDYKEDEEQKLEPEQKQNIALEFNFESTLEREKKEVKMQKFLQQRQKRDAQRKIEMEKKRHEKPKEPKPESSSKYSKKKSPKTVKIVSSKKKNESENSKVSSNLI